MAMSGPAVQKVLVVEDEAMVRMLVVQTLIEAGYAVREAAEANSAMAALDNDTEISLMVTDLGLPGINGRRLADKVRIKRPGMKVLFMTGYEESPLLETGLPEGCALIHKPFTLDDLTAQAGRLLAN
jgi:DNA-binding response OmpR family regulator